MRDSFERDTGYYQRVRDYAETFVPEQQALGFILLESGQVVFVDEDGTPYEVLVRGDTLVLGRAVNIPEQEYEPITERQAMDILAPRRYQQTATYRVSNLQTYQPQHRLSFGRFFIGLILIAIILAGAIFVISNFLPKETKNNLVIWSDNLSKAVNPVATAIAPKPTVPVNRVDAPAVRAPMAIVLNANTGEVLYSKEPTRRAAMASTTKIMTALTALNVPGVSLDDTYTVVKEDLPQYSDETTMFLKVGQTVTFRELLYGMMLPSGNDAARAIARYAGAKLPGTGDTYSRFIEQMNKQASVYGLKDSRFANPHGLDAANHYSSVYDLAILGKLLLDNPTLAEVVATPRITINGRAIVNSNYFLNKGGNGIKPGFTDGAGLCLVSSMTRNNQTVIVAIMGGDRTAYNSDPLALTEYAFSRLISP
jgi:serine-type D-Ala-D-Ala carboxypeptidase (penicillin-binding protein 5/6)